MSGSSEFFKNKQKITDVIFDAIKNNIAFVCMNKCSNCEFFEVCNNEGEEGKQKYCLEVIKEAIS